MDIQRAKELLTVLAEGVDPLTGEVLPDDHVCNKGEIVRALNCAVEELSRRRKKPLPENNGKPWTEELDDELLSKKNTSTFVSIRLEGNLLRIIELTYMTA